MFLTIDSQNLPHQKFLFTKGTTVFTGTYMMKIKLKVCQEIVVGSSHLS